MCVRHFTVLTTLCILLWTAAAQAAVTLTLTNGPDLMGRPGEPVGWDFTLFNDLAYELNVNLVYADGTLFGTGGSSALGTFLDDISTHGGLTVAAGDTATGSFSLGTGLASFLLDANAPAGATPVTGYIYLDYEYSDSINTVTETVTAQFGGAEALASVTTVPEPSTYALLGIALGVVGMTRKMMSRHADRR